MVILPRITVDFEHLIHAVLRDPLDGLQVIPAVDVDTVDTLPVLLYSGINGHMIANGSPELGWQWTLMLTLLAKDRVSGGDMTDTIYQTIHGLESTYVPGIGGVSTVNDDSMFSRTATAAVAGSDIVQYDASFTLIVRK